MSGVEGDCLVEVVDRFIGGLFWDGVDEVEIEVVDACLMGELNGAGDGFGIVPAFECFEVRGVEGLAADADTVDAAFYEVVHEFGGDGFGVGFDGEFGEV